MDENKQMWLESLISNGLKYEEVEKKKAAERKALTRKNGLKIEDAKYFDGTKGQTRDIVAKKLGISGKQWDRIKYIYKHREQVDEQQYQDWMNGRISTSKLYSKLLNIRKYTDELEKMQNSIGKIKQSILDYSYCSQLMAAKSKLSYTLYNYPDKVKQEVFQCLDDERKISNDLIKEIFLEITKLEHEVTKLKRRNRNDVQI